MEGRNSGDGILPAFYALKCAALLIRRRFAQDAEVWSDPAWNFTSFVTSSLPPKI
jgi:hypothetical protein